MEKEELKSKIEVKLGSTKLQLSERTWDKYLTKALKGIKDDSEVTDDWLNDEIDWLKTLNGQLHADVSTEVEDWKKKYQPSPKPKEKEEVLDGEPEWFKKYREDQESRIKAIEDARKSEVAEAERKATVNKIKNGFEEKLRESGIQVNNYFLKTSMSELEIPEKDIDIKSLVSELETRYNANMKEAGVDFDSPHGGFNGGGGKTDKFYDDFIKQKTDKWNNN